MKNLLSMCLLLVVLAALTAPSCGGGGGNQSGSQPITLEAPAAAANKDYSPALGREGMPEDVAATDGGSPSGPAGDGGPVAPDVAPPSMRIYRATLRLQVDDPTEAAAQVRTLAQQHGAWLQTEREERENWEHRAYLELRVPPARLDSFLNRCMALARFVAQKDLSTEDVGQSYADLTARLTQKREVAAQYQQLLKRAASVQDILAVQEHLRRLQEEIESTEAQRLYLSRQAAYSTVMLTLYRPMEGQREPQVSFWARLGTAVGDGWQALQDFVLLIVTAWGVLLPLGLGVWLVLRWRRRWREKRSRTSAR